ncbi:MAG: hypothetical protein WA051_00205 [Minisyncoccia bacterium]
MKKNILFFIPVLIVFLFFGLAHTRGAVVDWGDNYIVQKNTEINSNLYIAGQQLTMMGKVFGDVLGAGGNIFINDDVNGDVMLAGGTVNVVSTITHDLRIIGATIIVSGKIGGDLAVVGNNIRIVESTNASVVGDVLIAGNTIILSAPVSGTVKISGADVTINGIINGDARIVADKLHIGPNAVIKGVLSYKSVRMADISETAKVLGETKYEKVYATGPDSSFFSMLWDSLFWVKFIAIFVSSMILFAVGKRSMTALSERARQNPFQNFFAGILFFIGAPISAALLIITVIGVPLSIAVVGLLIIFAIIAVAFTPILVGTTVKKLLKRGDSASWKAILLGSFIISLLALIPFVGSIVRTILFLISEGVMIRVALEKLQKIRT